MAEDNKKGAVTIEDGAASTPETKGLENKTYVARIKALEKENMELRVKMGIYNVPQPINKTFEMKDKTYRFADGHKQVRVPQLGLVSSEGLLDIAAGNKVSKELMAYSPVLEGITQEQATAYLSDLVTIGYGYFNEVKK